MKKTKQTTLSTWATTITNSTAVSSGADYYYYPTAISGGIGFNFDTKPTPLKEDQEIEITLLDGTEVTMTLKDYFSFIAYNLMVPSDCKDLDEFNEKMLVFRI